MYFITRNTCNFHSGDGRCLLGIIADYVALSWIESVTVMSKSAHFSCSGHWGVNGDEISGSFSVRNGLFIYFQEKYHMMIFLPTGFYHI